MNVEATTSPESITQIASLEQLCAAKLGMMPRQIDAIEHGRWEALPGTAFVRGAIRAYGKALQLDVAPLLATLGSPNGAPELKPSSSLDSPLPRHGALGLPGDALRAHDLHGCEQQRGEDDGNDGPHARHRNAEYREERKHCPAELGGDDPPTPNWLEVEVDERPVADFVTEGARGQDERSERDHRGSQKVGKC